MVLDKTCLCFQSRDERHPSRLNDQLMEPLSLNKNFASLDKYSQFLKDQGRALDDSQIYHVNRNFLNRTNMIQRVIRS